MIYGPSGAFVKRFLRASRTKPALQTAVLHSAVNAFRGQEVMTPFSSAFLQITTSDFLAVSGTERHLGGAYCILPDRSSRVITHNDNHVGRKEEVGRKEVVIN